jgi:hypothetical protein
MKMVDLILFLVFNATFSNISAISWRLVLVMSYGILLCKYKNEQENPLKISFCFQAEDKIWCLMPLSAIFQLYHGDKF